MMNDEHVFFRGTNESNQDARDIQREAAPRKLE
jgi:hypothetical protein